MSLRPTLLLAACLTACAGSAPSPLHREFDPTLEQKEQQKLDADADRQDFHRVLLQLDVALESYVKVLDNRGSAKADQELGRLEKLLRELVSGKPPGRNTDRLLALAADSSDRIKQGTALAALGFANNRDVMAVILQGAQQSDRDLVDRAILGLAILKDPRTPPGVPIAVMNDKKHHDEGRNMAAWALLELQPNSEQQAEILAEWRKVLAPDSGMHPLILATAIRGLGLTRNAADAAPVAGYLKHPTNQVRIAAAIALGRMNAQSHWRDLLERLQPVETNANVRLAVRKALQALAGGVDRGYDIELWRREFDRGAKS